MDLIDRKRIINKELPRYKNGEQPKWIDKNAENIVTAGASLLGFGAQMNSAGDYNKSQDDLNMQAGQSQSSTGGYGYQTQNAVDASREAEEVKAKNKAETLGLMGSGAATGAAVGSLLGPVGGIVGGAVGGIAGLVGGLFGGKNRERKMKEAIRKQQYEAGLRNEFNRARANTSRLSDAYAEENGFDATQYLNTGFAKGKQPVYSPFGKINAAPDSKVSKGEVAIDTRTGSRYRIPTGPNDTALFAGGKNPYTAIITNKYGLSDIAMNDPETAIALQGALKENGMLGRNKQGYKCGKMPKYKIGRSPKGDLPPVLEDTVFPEIKYDIYDEDIPELTEEQLKNIALKNQVKRGPVIYGSKNKSKIGAAIPVGSANPKFAEMDFVNLPVTNMNIRNVDGAKLQNNAEPKVGNIGNPFIPTSMVNREWMTDLPLSSINPASIYSQESPKFRDPSLTVSEDPVFLDIPNGPISGAQIPIPTVTPNFRQPGQIDVKPSNVKNPNTAGGKKEKGSDKLSWIPNAISSGLGLLAGYNQYTDAKNQSVYKPDTYVRNPYSGKANSILAGLRPNELPIINSILKERDAANYGLVNSGGLTTAQKYLGRIATARNSQANIYNALANLQNMHNQYRSAYANSLLQQGAQEAANQMAAMRADNDVYMRGHAARQQGMQVGMQNMLAQLQQGIANEEKRRMFNKMYGLYAA